MNNRDFDLVVIGGGHAGVEAALAAERMGLTVAVVTMDPTRMALMSCNPAIGGIGKSQLVKEIDALGGLMGEAIDATGIQFRRLNLSRGPAVWSTRAQADRRAYSQYVVDFVSSRKRVEVIEGLVGEITVENGRVVGVRTESGRSISCRTAVVATGTFLGGVIHVGERHKEAGREGDRAAYRLSESLRELGFELGRLKTGTPPRLDGNTIDWDQCRLQPGEEPPPFFSYRSPPRHINQVPCHLTRTTQATGQMVSDHHHLSPIFSGSITSVGPRYCPSIEDKVMRFADKSSHQIFLEPEGNGTDEIYPNGFSTALPEEVQREAIRTVIGLEEVSITRPGYAVEYDYCPSHQVKPSLETWRVGGLFMAGQINGTSGYEEAAALGLVAGINAALLINGQEPLVLDRSEAYIGVMIDDLVTRSTTEPYRMFTSRAEYRLALREDNARDRLFKYSEKLGLVPREDISAFAELTAETEKQIARLGQIRFAVDELGDLGRRFKKATTVSATSLLRQPGIDLAGLLPFLPASVPGGDNGREALERAAVRIRYQGYIRKQAREIGRYSRLEKERIPDGFEYHGLAGLRNEAVEKFTRYQPDSLGRAGRIEGITPSDIAVLAVYLRKHKDSGA
jgi:tRNA uridine 5-carboxymethylaminomethyl modification enzyme